MARIRSGSKGVLLIVDVQVGVMQQTWNGQTIIGNISCAVNRAREHGTPVLWIQHSDEDLVHGSPEWQWVPELAPQDEESVIHKHFNSAFEETSLEDALSQHQASHIVLAGAATNWCIRATAYAALDRGYDLTLLSDAHTTETIELKTGARIEASQVIEDLNLAMTWLDYPDLANGTARAADVNFDRPE